MNIRRISLKNIKENPENNILYKTSSKLAEIVARPYTNMNKCSEKKQIKQNHVN